MHSNVRQLRRVHSRETRDREGDRPRGNNPSGIGAAIARALASQGSDVFVHFFRQAAALPDQDPGNKGSQEPGLAFYLKQQAKTADEVLESIRESGGKAESWEGDLRKPETADRLFEQVEKTFGHVAVNSRAVAILMAKFARRIIERKKGWGRIINISADCA